MEDLSPMRSGFEGFQSRLDQMQNGVDRFGFVLPGEVDSQHITVVGRAHPEVVGSDTADF